MFSIVCVLPSVLISQLNVPFYFGGTALLIVVGVAMDTASQIESHLLTRQYEGFMKKRAYCPQEIAEEIGWIMVILKLPEEIEKARASNRIVAEVLSKLREKVKPGVRTRELDNLPRKLRKKGSKTGI